MQITCSCGKVLKVRDDLIGKRVRCPECDERLLVEAPADPAPRKKAAPKPGPVESSPRPTLKKRPVRPPEPDEDEDEEDEEPRPRKKRGQSRPREGPSMLRLAIGGGVLVVVLAVAVIVWVMRLR